MYFRRSFLPGLIQPFHPTRITWSRLLNASQEHALKLAISLSSSALSVIEFLNAYRALSFPHNN
uniref:Uncharacterized protein n=5 Tax=Vibrionaceae TaxID=641 RepID=A0A0H3ZR95_9VIBR|nr:hypothetical protein [Enterovibrio sp. FF_113]AKN38165.1 hypothetical protein [Vibrio sp. FF_304]AKN38775.1 hypothetical protein [Vibrio tasmaniensis]AKN39722.1 hypothetical protein [Enterovibrio sp. FF_113]AKN40083.1 hypothetical protein [Enterovibrio norvegicus]